MAEFLKGTSPSGMRRLSKLEIELLASGETKQTFGGHDIPCKLNETEWKYYKTAQEVGYLIYKSTKTRAVENIWYEYCASTNSPYVVARITGKTCILHVDLYDYEYRLGRNGVKEVEGWILENGLKLTDHTLIGCCVIEIPKIPVNRIDTLARGLLQIINSPFCTVRTKPDISPSYI